MSVYDQRQQLRQREMDEDPLLALMYGMRDVDMDKIAAHVKKYKLTARELAILERVVKDHHTEPRLFMQMFGMWLAPELNLAEGPCHAASNPSKKRCSPCAWACSKVGSCPFKSSCIIASESTSWDRRRTNLYLAVKPAPHACHVRHTQVFQKTDVSL